jgi:galactose mutarotase-like enzyme
VPVTGGFERRSPGPLPAGIDATWTHLDERQVELRWPDLETRATLTVSDTVGFVVAAAPADLDAVAVEPQTHGPDGIRRLIEDQVGAPSWISPGAALTARLELTFSRA